MTLKKALKLCAQHYIITHATTASRSESGKARLIEFRIKNRDSLGTEWTAHWRKGEFMI